MLNLPPYSVGYWGQCFLALEWGHVFDGVILEYSLDYFLHICGRASFRCGNILFAVFYHRRICLKYLVGLIYGVIFLHFVISLENRHMVRMFAYTQRTSLLSEIVSNPCVGNSWPSLSCLKSISIGVSGDHYNFICYLLAVMSIDSYFPQRCFKSSLADTVVYFMRAFFSSEMYRLPTLWNILFLSSVYVALHIV